MVKTMYKYHLSDVEWGEFFIGGRAGIFDICATKSGIDKNKLNMKRGNIPYITRSEIDNGINLFITDDQNQRYNKDKGNVITIGLDTQTVFYQKNAFFTGQNIQVLSNEKLNKNIAMFIIPLIKIQMKKFNWGGNGATLTRLNRTKIMLPIDNHKEPNWHFMNEYIKERENNQKENLKKYYKNRLLDLVVCPEILKDVEWGEFSLRDLFVFERGNQNNMSVCEVGEIPLISAKKVDNGVKAFISDNGKKIFEGHILTLNNDGDGGVGIAYYQANKIALDTHVTALIPIIPVSRNSLLFISKTITIQRDKFSHGYSLNNHRMKSQKIVLSIDENGTPNWNYMDNFIKSIEQKQIKNVLKYLDIYI